MNRLLLIVMIALCRPYSVDAAEYGTGDAAEVARTAVLARLTAEGYTATVSIVGDSKQRSTNIRFDAQRLRPITGRWPRPRLPVTVDLLQSGRLVAASTIWLAIEIPSELLAYADHHAAGERLDAKSLTRRRINLANVAGTPLAPEASMSTLRLAHAVRAGQVAKTEDFETLPDVLRNATVILTAESGPVRVRTPAIALQDGRIGDVVAVRPDRAEDAVRATVTDKDAVLLTLGGPNP